MPAPAPLVPVRPAPRSLEPSPGPLEIFADGLAIEIRRDDRVLYDSPLEGDGFELPVPRELGLRRGRRLALYLGSLTLRRRGPDWNATKRRRDSERRASTAAERGIEKTDELRRLKNAIAVGTPITGRPPGHRRRSPAPGSHRT